MDKHKLLLRQLKRAGINPDSLPESEQSWLEFIDSVNKTYHQADQERYLQDRSMMIITEEMDSLNNKLLSLQKVGHLGYWYYNVTTGINNWSRSMYHMFGLSPGVNIPSLEKIYEDLVHPDDLLLLKDCMEKAAQEGKAFETEIRLKKFGTVNGYKWYYLIGERETKKHPNHKLIHAIVMDIDRHKTSEDIIINLEKTVVESDKMAILGQLSAGIAHEINNPLSYALANMGVMQKRVAHLLKLLELHQDTVDQIQKQKIAQLQNLVEQIELFNKGKSSLLMIQDLNNMLSESTEGLLRIKKIVSSMRNFSGVEKIQLERIDINECIESAIKIVSSELEAHGTIHKSLADLPQIMGSHTQLMIVFVNLLLNAKQAIPEGGEVKVSTELKETSVVVSISDNGAGIVAENIPKIFTPFFSTKPVGSGSGLGLSIAYGIVQLHKGKITIESEVNSGSIFTVELPIHQDVA